MLSINYAMRIFTFERPVLQHECTTTRFRVLIFGTQGVNISSIFLIISKCLLYTKIWKKYVLSITHSDDVMRSNSLTTQQCVTCPVMLTLSIWNINDCLYKSGVDLLECTVFILQTLICSIFMQLDEPFCKYLHEKKYAKYVISSDMLLYVICLEDYMD